MSKQRVYYGWIIVSDGGPGMNTVITVEYTDGKDIRKSYDGKDEPGEIGWYGERGCALAVEWWDRKVGKPVQLQPMLKGSYRVYTEEN